MKNSSKLNAVTSEGGRNVLTKDKSQSNSNLDEY